jgi:DNA mismatch repair protein MutL
MASVSELTVESRHWELEIGSRIRVVEGRLEGAGENMARSQGTTVSLRNLFRNNPVRRKFLASGKAEGGRISAMLARLSLAHPGTAFKLTEGSRELLQLPEGTFRRRAGDVLGTHVLGDLAEVDWEGGGIHVQGFVSEPQRFSSRQGQQHFFVNRRHVHSGLLCRALLQAYESIPPGRYPVAALFLTLPSSEVDVNVHPTKREVRFLQEARVFWALSQALRRSLRQSIGAPQLDLGRPSAFSGEPGDSSAGVAESGPGGFSFAADAAIHASDAPTDSQGPDQLKMPLEPRTSAPSASELGAPCLQIHRGFILVAVQSGFLLVNQRAAHERILYERALEDMRAARDGSRFNAQQLLFPELLEFTAPEARLLEERLGELRSLGFDLEPFGSTAFQLRGLPAEVPAEKAPAILQSLIAGLLDAPRGEAKSARDALSEKVAKAYARAAAIPLGEALDAARMATLVDGLFATRNPYVTPGGDPVLIRYSLEEIRRRFGIREDYSDAPRGSGFTSASA